MEELEGNSKKERLNKFRGFKILVATDNHLGYKEKDRIRGMDSFNAFEEVLKIGRE